MSQPGYPIQVETKQGDKAVFELPIPNPEPQATANKLWMVNHSHRYGASQYLVAYPAMPTETQIVRCLGLNFEPEIGEFIDIGPVETVTVLDLQASDHVSE